MRIDAGPIASGFGRTSAIISSPGLPPSVAVMPPAEALATWSCTAWMAIDDTGSLTSTSIVSSPLKVSLAKFGSIAIA